MPEQSTHSSAKFTDFADFYRATYSKLIAFLLRNGTDRSEAEDFAQEAMISLFKAWGTAADPTAYAYKAAIRTLIARRTRGLQERDLAIRLARLDGRDTGATPSDADEVRRALRALKPEQRIVMALTVDGFKPAEIAALTGKSAATVRSNLRLARENLIKKLYPHREAREGGATWIAAGTIGLTNDSSRSERRRSTSSAPTSTSRGG
ncbi:RNA polymerase sigma factor [Dactylosporangium sp. NPDC051541]|uniref:RNA polymerase sigma factor n=1 Tax=Dactylosporangium sp. NPDC051541 TaxID=3363977 RepID=UPI00379C9124